VKPLALAAPLLLVLVGTAACGESDKEKAAQERYRKAVAEYKADLKNWKEDQVTYDECTDSLGTFRSEIKELDGRLSVGLSFDDYSTKVGDVAAAYNQADFQGGGLDCLTEVGLPLETATTQYEKAYDIWQKCFEGFDCDSDSITPDLQGHWEKASREIDRSDRALERFKVGPRPEPPPKPKALK
jgi:hypothetical protein